MNILALDPGTRETGFVLFDGKRVAYSGVQPNDDVLRMLTGWTEPSTRLATEVFQSMGMAVGQEVFDTAIWIGRFVQAWHTPEDVLRIKRTQVKLHLCGSSRAKDPNVRQALLDAVGPTGNKHNPGPTFGVKSHAWSALGVAVTAQAMLGVGMHGTMFHEKPAVQQAAEAGAF